MSLLPLPKYIPTLSVRPAEIRGLRELPQDAKARLLPHILLRPWTTAKSLDSALEKVFDTKCKSYIFDIDSTISLKREPGERPVFRELRQLKEARGGYQRWIDFNIKHGTFPVALIGSDPAENVAQIHNLSDAGIPFIIKLSLSENFKLFKNQMNLLRSTSDILNKNEVAVLLDCSQQSRDWAQKELIISNIIKAIRKVLNSPIIISSTTFPSSFEGVKHQSIYERTLFSKLSKNNSEIFYGDRGSARAFSDQGGGGAPLPRIDLPVENAWYFFRKRPKLELNDDGDDISTIESRRENRFDAYVKAAKSAKRSDWWDSTPNIWAHQMIEDTAAGNGAITSPAMSTSVRINMHLYTQAFYGEPEGNTGDEPWEEF